SSLPADWVRRIVPFFPTGGYLGLSGRSLSQQRASQRTKPGEFLALVYERSYLGNVSLDGRLFRRLPVYLFCVDDGGAVLRGSVGLSGNQGGDVGSYAEENGNCVTGLWARLTDRCGRSETRLPQE